uniref:Uncharacterized protein n=1 Tax=viral metagenome TaxID=1070528 RepID=A0A6C0KZG1_9ZZZZ
MDAVLVKAITAACFTCLLCCVFGQLFICCMDRREKEKKNKVQPV